MSTITDKKITNGQRDAVWVQHQPNRLTGTPKQNQAVFDEYAELIREHFNEAMDAIDERISTNDSDIEQLKETDAGAAATAARESAESASESAQTTSELLGRVISISNKRYVKDWDITDEQDEFEFTATDYTYNDSDTYEVFVNGLKLADSEFTRSENSVILNSSISGTGNTVEIIVTTNLKGKGIADTELNDDYTLTINYDDGTFMTTESIRGEKGEKGDKGDKGEEYDDTQVRNDIAVLDSRVDSFTHLTEGSTTGDAELIDARIGADGTTYSNAGNAIRGQVSDLKSDLVPMIELNTGVWELGYINDNGNNTNASDIIRTRSSIQIEPDTRICVKHDTNIKYKGYYLNEAGEVIGFIPLGTAEYAGYTPSSAKYLRLIIAESTDTTASQDLHVYLASHIMETMVLAKDRETGYKIDVQNIGWVLGSLSSTGEEISVSYYLRSDFYQLRNISKIKFYRKGTASYSCTFYDKDKKFVSQTTWQILDREMEVPATAEYLRVVLSEKALKAEQYIGISILPRYAEEMLELGNLCENTVNLNGASEGRYAGNDTTGAIVSASNNYFGLSKRISVIPNTKYVVRANTVYGNSKIYAIFYNDDSVIESAVSDDYLEYSFTTPQNCNYVYFYMYNGSGITINEHSHFVLTLLENYDTIYYPPVSGIDSIARSKLFTGGMDINVATKIKSARYLDRNTKLFTLLHFSDLHESRVNLSRIKHFKELYADYLDDAICTGDMVRRMFSNGYDFWDEFSDGSILTCIGNHDVWAGTNPDFSDMVTQAQAYERYFEPYLEQWDAEIPKNKTYYYKDYPTYGIRLVAINCMLTDSSEVAEQNAWLQNTLSDALTNEYAVLCASHYTPADGTFIPSTFTTLLRNGISTSLNSVYLQSVDAFKRSGGEFICWLGGHVHFDALVRSEAYPDQMFISVAAASAGESNFDLLRDYANDKTIDCFNVMSIDTTNKRIKLFRVGADFDTTMRYRRCLYYDYSTNSVVYSN